LQYLASVEPIFHPDAQEVPSSADVPAAPISLPEADLDADIALKAFVELRSVETEVRAIIGLAMSEAHGNDWFSSRVPLRLLNKWTRYRQNALLHGEEEAPLLYYADF